jgi:formylglycine-generating enzyme required for sulfatase activity
MSIKILGDYSLIKELGKGTLGSVYLAEHRYIKKKYAIKILSEVFSDEEFLKRYEKEVGALATLDHPSIVKLHNISFVDNSYFLVMDGIVNAKDQVIDLDTYLSKKGKIIPEKEVEAILRQVASALDYAHDVKIQNEQLVHRGIKLSNIFIDESEKGLRVLISDFGLTKLIGEERVLIKNYENMVNNFSMGVDSSYYKSFAFLSPEQKNNEKITIKSDIYSFGVLAYYLITREFPEGFFEMPSKIAPEYKLNWDLFICKCLQRDQKKRPERLTEALNTMLSKETTNVASIDILSWEEVEKKVENAMQMSFEFSPSPKEEKKELRLEIEEEHKPIIKPQKLDRPQYEPDPGAIFQKDLNVCYYQPKKEEIKEVEPLLTEMVIIPEGSYLRGSNNGSRDEMPAHVVTISSFALDIHPVTNEQFVRFLESMGGEKDVNNNDIIRLRDSRIKRSAGKLIVESGYIKHPVVGVTWYGASAYAKWIGKRLPFEAEWEISAAAGLEENIYPTGTKIDHTQANFFSSDTTAVMSYPPNGYGLYDMVGNVYDWCQDWYAYNYYETSSQEPENPKGPPQGVYRVLRGGCWKSLKEDLRCAHRHRNNPGAFNTTYGFRCAADVT